MVVAVDEVAASDGVEVAFVDFYSNADVVRGKAGVVEVDLLVYTHNTYS